MILKCLYWICVVVGVVVFPQLIGLFGEIIDSSTILIFLELISFVAGITYCIIISKALGLGLKKRVKFLMYALLLFVAFSVYFSLPKMSDMGYNLYVMSSVINLLCVALGMFFGTKLFRPQTTSF